MSILSALLAGLVFGLGLIIAGMANPAKVLAFLDIAGNWDPSLAFVMIGAISVAFVAFRIAAKRGFSLFGERIELPTSRKIDFTLIGGSILFGIGWGLAGICPGPGFVLLGSGEPGGWIFIAALFAGLLFASRIKPMLSR
jgi:uncharacterized protein